MEKKNKFKLKIIIQKFSLLLKNYLPCPTDWAPKMTQLNVSMTSSNVRPNKHLSMMTPPTTNAAAIAQKTIEFVKANMIANRLADLIDLLMIRSI